MSQVIAPPSAPKAKGYADGLVVEAGRQLFISGQIAWDGTGRIVSDDFATQFLKALDNLLEVVKTAGGRGEDVAKLTIFVTDLDAYRAATRAIGEGWRVRLARHYPTMSLVKVAGLLEPGALVEIEGIAVISSSSRQGTP